MTNDFSTAHNGLGSFPLKLFDLSNYQITSKRGKVVTGKYKWHYFSANDSKIGLALSSPLLIVMVT